MPRFAFASQLSELDETLERLDVRCNRFMKGSKRYKEGINTLSESQNVFADFLEEFCGGTDEESMILGNELMLIDCMSAIAPYKVLHAFDTSEHCLLLGYLCGFFWQEIKKAHTACFFLSSSTVISQHAYVQTESRSRSLKVSSIA